MPLVLDDSQLAPEGERAAIPQAPTDSTPAPSALDVLAAAERQSNVAAMAYDRFYANPRPDVAPVPGFDPLSSIPKGYEPFADRFLDAESPQEVQWIKGRIDQERSDQQTIARAGGWGVAATLAAGATDPLTIASMALPGGGETRLAQAGRLAMIGAGTTAAQEAIAQGLTETRTMGESLTNVGASAILGGILGAAIRPHVPPREFGALSAKLGADAEDPAATEAVLGPAQRSVLDAPLPSQASASLATGATQGTAAVQASAQAGAAVGERIGQSTLLRISAEHASGPGTSEMPLSATLLTNKGVRLDVQRAFNGRYDLSVDGQNAGILSYTNTPAGGYRVTGVEVSPSLRRQGIATAAYDFLEHQVLGQQLERTGSQSEAGAAFRAARAQSVESAAVPGEGAYTVSEEPITDEQLRQFQGLRSDVPGQQDLGAARGGEPGQPGYQNDGGARAGADERLRVWRGASRELSPADFEPASLGRASGHPSSGLGVFFSQESQEASRYGSVTEHALDIRNPKVIRVEDLPPFDSLEQAHAFREQLRAKGYDGIVIDGSHLGGPVNYVAFEPRQVLEAPKRASLAARAQTAAAAEAPEPAPPSAPAQEAPAQSAPVNPETESTMGAAAVHQPTRAELTSARGGKLLTRTVGRVAPAGRIMNRASVKARELLTELANIPGTLAQNYRGIASANPIERILWGYEGLNVQGIKFRRAAYGEYLARIAREEGGAPIPRRAFMEAIASAMRRGDRSEIPEVAKAARFTRENIFDPLYQRALKLGLVPEDTKLHADSYLTRLYDARAIRRNFGGWIETLRQGFIAQGVDPAEATDIAHAATRNVLGSERGLMDWRVLEGIVPKSGNLKERTLALPDKLLEPFLVNDIDHLSHSYLRSMAPEVEMTERFGSRDLKDQFQDITDEYAHLIEQARAGGDVAKMTALDAERNATLKDLAAVRDRLYGIYGAPKDPGAFFVRAGRLLRNVNATRLLGAATLAHFPDLGNTIARYGLANTFGAMAKLASSLKASKLSLVEAQRMGAAIDMTMNITASLLGDFGSHSRFLEQRVASGLTRLFTIVTGETPLITLVQAMTSTLAQDEILRTAERVAGGGALESNLAAKLAASGLDDGMLRRIAAEGAAHARTANGLRFGLSDTWADQQAARAFESAVLREAHGVTLRPGVGDTPLFMSTEWGKSLGQFKSFAYAASRVVGLPLAQGLAHGDVRAVEALFALAAMGTLSYVAKQKAAGQALETNPTRLALEVLDKSNLLGWTGEVIYPALWQAGFRSLSRWSDRDPVETLLGPSAGLVASTWERQFPARLANLVTGGELAPDESLALRRSDLHFLRRMMPGQNLWYFRRGVNALEDSVGDLFNLPGQSQKEHAEQLAQGQ